MAGIYIHIPFCKQACYYCDFHFSTTTKNRQQMVNAIMLELQLQKSFFSSSTIINTIYFGGGTPSILPTDCILKIIDTIYVNFNVANDAEITLEANPDDLTAVKIKELKSSPINRFSIGIQSFIVEELKWMNRAHNVQQADYAVKATQDAGFTNITIDLIYGLPQQSNQNWLFSLQKAFELNVPHLSSYCLTVEEKTTLNYLIKTKKYNNISNKIGQNHFLILLEQAQQNNFTQYEISNFAKAGFESKHNSNYWKSIPYLGIGPSAHSFNGVKRFWNIKNNALYISSLLEKKTIPFEEEILSPKDLYNEYVMISLRTAWGCNLEKVQTDFGNEMYTYLLNNSTNHIKNNNLIVKENILYLTNQGKLYADKIASDLFLTEDINESRNKY